ncbi:CBS domain-containing protein [Frankia sp. AgKG'84/4]|uniref:CBS domain-containing protein n=1 Tax=Frankia sp. AgKG'84/4 TaxID=573490 RepID=UPI00200C554D|nr:CBS domain-containing protein [Frankia sp. AgKG'84/4]MCL9793649.1 CBS domain-containing protein [Frankia sp. AgKG'84/4]
MSRESSGSSHARRTHADVLGRALAGRPVRDCLPAGRPALPVADADDTVVEVAALMARRHSPLVAVVERHGQAVRILGVITATDLLDRLLGPR